MADFVMAFASNAPQKQEEGPSQMTIFDMQVLSSVPLSQAIGSSPLLISTFHFHREKWMWLTFLPKLR